MAEGGVAIDLSGMKGIQVDPDALTARVEAGVLWGEFYAEAGKYGLATTGGQLSSVGVAGLTLGGGVGWLMRKHGLTCDNLIAAEVVTAEGDLLTASDAENADLFWGLRGGGGNFGIVSAFHFRLHPVYMVLGGAVLHPVARAGEALRFYRDFVQTAPDELTTLAAFLTLPGLGPVLALAACYAGDLQEGEAVVRPLREFGPPIADQLAPMPYVVLQTIFDEGAAPGFLHHIRSEFLHPLTDEAIDTVVALASRTTSPLSQVHLIQLGGAVSRVAPGATAFRHREAPHLMAILSAWSDSGESERHIAWTEESWKAMLPFSSGGAYVNFMGSEGPERVKAAYGDNYDRLVALKNKYDPGNFFRLNQNIRPSE
jgi:FAD/FMN-containing dehydrogenase